MILNLSRRVRAALNAFIHGEEHKQVRHYAATKSESEAVRRKREATTAQLRREVTERQLLAAVEKAVGL